MMSAKASLKLRQAMRARGKDRVVTKEKIPPWRDPAIRAKLDAEHAERQKAREAAAEKAPANNPDYYAAGADDGTEAEDGEGSTAAEKAAAKKAKKAADKARLDAQKSAKHG